MCGRCLSEYLPCSSKQVSLSEHSARAFCNWSSLSPPGLTQEIGDEHSLCKEGFFVTLGTALPSTPALGHHSMISVVSYAGHSCLSYTARNPKLYTLIYINSMEVPRAKTSHKALLEYTYLETMSHSLD